jgi:hypothetical protein
MNRLRDYSGDGPVSERGIEMLRGTPATNTMPDLKRRIWSTLEQMPAEPVGGLRVPGVKALVLGITIFSLAGTAGAVITDRWIVPAIEKAQTNVSVPAPRAERRRAVRRIAVAPVREETRPDVAQGMPEEAIVPAPAPVRAAAPVKAHARPSAGAAVHAPASPPTTQERTQVLDALIALRHDHDPVRAGALLDTYLVAHPRGALREEALVLATEAADARGDHALAQRLARIYQADYPQGRFRQYARSHMQSSPAASPVENP